MHSVLVSPAAVVDPTNYTALGVGGLLLPGRLTGGLQPGRRPLSIPSFSGVLTPGAPEAPSCLVSIHSTCGAAPGFGLPVQQMRAADAAVRQPGLRLWLGCAQRACAAQPVVLACMLGLLRGIAHLPVLGQGVTPTRAMLSIWVCRLLWQLLSAAQSAGS